MYVKLQTFLYRDGFYSKEIPAELDSNAGIYYKYGLMKNAGAYLFNTTNPFFFKVTPSSSV